MIKDSLVEFAGHQFECVDKGFGLNEPVDVVIRPEDIYIFEMSDAAQFSGQVTSSIFKGVHYEMMVTTPEGFEFMIQDYHHFEVGETVGLRIKPFDIHVMKKERLHNVFEGTLVDKNHVKFLGTSFECADVNDIEPGSDVLVKIDFSNVNLQDNEEDGNISGDVSFILYKGNHYHLTVLTDEDENIFADTNDVWDVGDRVGITIPPDAIQVEKR
jgi:spermidine/putrescine transport system ATP-binding protein